MAAWVEINVSEAPRSVSLAAFSFCWGCEQNFCETSTTTVILLKPARMLNHRGRTNEKHEETNNVGLEHQAMFVAMA
jgi:hypothetical protein